MGKRNQKEKKEEPQKKMRKLNDEGEDRERRKVSAVREGDGAEDGVRPFLLRRVRGES